MEELDPLLDALGLTRFTLQEPSGQMRQAWSLRIAAAGASDRFVAGHLDEPGVGLWPAVAQRPQRT